MADVTLQMIFYGKTWKNVSRRLWKEAPFRADQYTTGSIPIQWAPDKEDRKAFRTKSDFRQGGSVAKTESQPIQAPTNRPAALGGSIWKKARKVAQRK